MNSILPVNRSTAYLDGSHSLIRPVPSGHAGANYPVELVSDHRGTTSYSPSLSPGENKVRWRIYRLDGASRG